MRLIDADTCLSQLKPYSPEDETWYVTGGTAKRLIHGAIDNTPIINPLDALGICRCKDCIYSEPCCNGDDYWICNRCEEEKGDFLLFMKPDDFCSYGTTERDE